MLLEDSGCQEKVGLTFWMGRVAQECERVGRDFAPEPVHDLRVALRRCRSIADGYMTYDPNRAWEEMMREGKTLFKSLGDLRDTQVMAEWVQLLAVGQDAPGNLLIDYLVIREKQAKEDGYQALQKFNLKRWASWSKQLSKRAGRIPLDGIVFQHLALARWQQAYELHHQALRNRSQVSFHRLRIGLKRFRYTVENFLPQLHERWGKDLRELQDLLGELHDLHVLWRTAVSVGAVKEAGARAVWRSRIAEARQQRLDQYRQKMLGTASLWRVWRASLPGTDQLKACTLASLETWASFRDPNSGHTAHVTRLAMQLYDGLKRESVVASGDAENGLFILHAAAILHNIGLASGGRRHRKTTYGMIRKLEPPLCYTAESLRLAAVVARYHRGAFPRLNHRIFTSLSEIQRRTTILDAAILRLAAAFESGRDQRITRLEVRKTGGAVLISADGYGQDDPLAEKLARARYPLEVACQMPVLIVGSDPGPEAHVAH